MNDPHTEARVRGAVARATGGDTAGAPVRRLAGHASLRSYWRVGAPPNSHVVMVLPPDARPEEVTKGGAPAESPFVDVQRYLSGLGVRVPRIHAFDEAEGLMVLEDLGDEMLETRLLAGDAPEPLYERAVDQLARLRAAAEARPTGSIAFSRSSSITTSTAGSSTISASGCSRPGRARRSPRGSGRSWMASSTGSPARSTPSRRASLIVTISPGTSWCCPAASRS